MPPKKEPPLAFDASSVPERSASEIRVEVLRLLNVEVAELAHMRCTRGLFEEESERLDKYGRLVAVLERSATKADEEKTDEEILADVLSKLPDEVLFNELKRRRR